MGKRSLVATEAGVKRAKAALKRQSLTQKALAYEIAIASWATVSKFFNNKPIDRHYFIEICERLHLDWQDIAAPFETEEAEQEELNAEISPELAAIQRNSEAGRIALEPYILPRIRREELLQKCLTAINRGIMEGKRRVIPILGAAGYGKSTILGNIYDELIAAKTAWVGLVRCNDLIDSVENFTIEIGEKLSGVKESITEITSRLATQHGRGVLLIDTLDLVLEKKLVPVLRRMLLQLLDHGTTVVFTCRESDYRDFFEPYHESFAGFTESIDRCFIPLFADKEVRVAAALFCEQELEQTPEMATQFAEKILTLAADSKSIADITRNPLLLALLCKLFGEDGNVPEDLTVSQLYQIYWDLRIAVSRKPRADSRRIGMAKKNLCLNLAATMYNAGDDRLRDFVYESQLSLDDVEFLAYEELHSDGVLQELGADRVGFFHQTFLEYAIARYFEATPQGETAKQQLLQHITQPENIYSKYFIWPIFRQLLNIVTFGEFYQIIHSLNQQELAPFRTIAFSAISRNEPESANTLLNLLPLALQQGDAYQDILLVAASSTPTRHIELVWELVLELLRQTEQTLVNKAAEVAGELLSRVPTDKNNPIEQALVAVTNRPTPPKQDAKEEAAKVFGKLISAYVKTPKIWGRGIDEQVLFSLKQRYFSFGGNARIFVLQLYLTPGVPQALQLELLMLIITKPITEAAKEKDSAIALLHHLLPNLILSGNSPFGQSWIEALYAQLPKGWDLIQAAVVGYQTVKDSELISILVNGLFKENLSREDAEKLRRHQVAIAESIKKGAGYNIATTLLKIDLTNLPKNRFSTISVVIREITTHLSTTHLSTTYLSTNSCDTSSVIIKEITTYSCDTSEIYLELAQWLLQKVSEYPLEIIPIIDILTSASTPVEPLLFAAIENSFTHLSANEIKVILKKLKNIPTALTPYLLNSTDKEARLALVRYYQKQVVQFSSLEAVKSLLTFCLDNSREVALDASAVILNLVPSQLNINIIDLINKIIHARIIGVQNNLLKAIIKIVETGIEVSDIDIIHACTALANENTPEILQSLYKLIESWIRVNNYIPIDLARLTFEITNRLISQASDKVLDASIANSAYITLKNIANLELLEINQQLGLCTRNLLKSTDVRAVNSVFVIGLLDKIAKLDDSFFEQIIEQDFVTDNSILPIANLMAVAVAIIYNQGKQSLLIDTILGDERLPLELKNQIIRERER